MLLDALGYIRPTTLIERKVFAEGGVKLKDETLQIASCATIRNPLVGTTPASNLQQLVDLSVAVGALLVKNALARPNH